MRIRPWHLGHVKGGYLVDFDLDFADIAALSEGKKASVILFHLRNTRTPHVIERLPTVLEDSPQALEKGAVVVVEESRHRVRFLPVSETGGKP